MIALLGCASAAGPAAASTWTGRQLSGEAAEMVMLGMSCPTTSFCVATGAGNTIATSTNPTGGAGDWSVTFAGAGAMPTPGSFSPARQIRGVDCTSPSLCVGVSFEGLIYTSTDPGGGSGAWSITDIDPPGPNTHMYGVSCPSPSFCAAVADKGRIITSTDPLGGQGAWTITELGESLRLRAISCASPTFCIAVGDEGQIVSSTNPTGGAGTWNRVQISGAAADRGLYGVSCPSPTLCVSGDSIGELLVSTLPGGPESAWTLTKGGASVQLTAADCLSPTQCVAIDNNGDVLTSTDPTGGAGAWTFTNIAPYPLVDEHDGVESNGFFGVSCPSPSLCAIAANRGLIYTSTDPFAAAPAPAATGKKSPAKGQKRKKRPRAKIAAQPAPGVEIKGRKTKVRFRFFAAGHAFTRGFVCKLDGRPQRRCKSPKTYRVGLGRHVFRVRAIGWTGLKGPAASVRFTVCHPTERGLCLGPIPGSR